MTWIEAQGYLTLLSTLDKGPYSFDILFNS
jgi:hypothetical protein